MRIPLCTQAWLLLGVVLSSGVAGCINPLYSPLPLALREAIVLTNDLGCSKKLFYARDDINLIWDMVQTTNGLHPRPNILVLSSEGVANLAADGREESFVNYDIGGDLYNGTLCDIDGDANLEVLGNLPGHGFDILVDADGETISRFPACDYDAPLIADVDGDGRKDVVLTDQSGRLEACRIDGQPIRSFQQEIKPWRYTVATDHESGKVTVVLYAYFARGVIYLLNESGDIQAHWPPPYEFYDVSIAPQEAGTPPLLMFASSNEFVFCDLSGKVAKTFNALLGTYVRTLFCKKYVARNQHAYYIFLANTKGAWDRTMLYIFSDGGDLLYHEILADSCRALFVRSNKSDLATWSVLVGGRNKVFEYCIPATE